ncbi:hypothetical protein [Enterococcus hermanniensis]|uniref:DUF1269 domain-containing protein n=1 Tax=Enterococcus hermanniensis TaxID=249189 RepID=A0A1L8TRK8_9ENTE|nr:hypothetical protein [Enterococcus hermanniensis]OJG46949.1 hypothetical protein RV04_GL000196 [Enterococcus hermanniensis]
MENVVTVNFKETSKAYEVLADLKTSNSSLKVLSAGIIENKEGVLTTKDGFSKESTGTNWATGGLIGGLLGIIGGPLGILFGGSLGMMLGDLGDLDEVTDKTDTFNNIAEEVKLNDTVLLILIQEDDPKFLDSYLFDNGAEKINRESLASIQQKIVAAEQVQEELEKEAKKKIKEQKKEEVKEKADSKIEAIKEHFKKI